MQYAVHNARYANAILLYLLHIAFCIVIIGTGMAYAICSDVTIFCNFVMIILHTSPIVRDNTLMNASLQN